MGGAIGVFGLSATNRSKPQKIAIEGTSLTKTTMLTTELTWHPLNAALFECRMSAEL